MRLLFYGLQNSGATLLTLLAGQRPGSVVVPDLWTMYCAPEIDSDLDICLKATITRSFPLEEHVAAFRPDHVFLVVRRPADNLVSLRRKHYARHNGTLEQKFRIADDAFGQPDVFTDVLVFESVATDPSGFLTKLADLGWELPENAAAFPRTALDMERFIWDQLPELYGSIQWGAGEARLEPLGERPLGRVEDEEADAFAKAHAPRLHEFYGQLPPAETRRVTVTSTALDDAALQNRSNYARSMLGIIEGCLREGRTSDALALAVELTELVPHNVDAWNVRARALEQSGSTDLAIRLLDGLSEAHPEDGPEPASVAVARARQALRLGRTERAAELAGAAAREHGTHEPAQLLAAEISAQQGKWDAARDHALQVLATQPRSVAAGVILANACAADGDVPAAVRILKSCLAVEPEFEPGRRRLAELLLSQGDPQPPSSGP